MSFDDGFEVNGVFPDISKAFDKVKRKGIIFKLKQNGISCKLLSVLSDFLKDRKQRVILNGQISSWTGVNAGVPIGSVLGPLLFLVYINNLADGESAKSHVLRANVPTCFACLRAHVPTCLTCLRAYVPCVLTCQRVLRAHVPTCLLCLGALVL